MKLIARIHKVIYLIICLILLSVQTKAQVSVSFFQRNRFEFKIEDCSDFMIINAGAPEKVDVTFELSGQGGMLVKGNFKGLDAPIGSTGYKGKIAEGLSYSSQANSVGLSLTQKLNAGEYQLCYQVIRAGTSEELASPCFDVQVLSMSPPLLIFPANNGVVSTLNPNLIWQGPLIAGGRSNEFHYDLKLAELLPDQEAYDGLNQNFALYKAEGLSSTQILYPFQAAKLSNGKSYAWQIVAKNNSGYQGETEIWKFTVHLDTFQKPEVIFFEGYLIPTKSENEGILNIRHALKLSFSESYPLNKLEFTLLDERKQTYATIDSNQVQIQDYNKFVIGLDGLSTPLKQKQVYYLKAFNPSTAESYLVKFRYYKN